MALPSVFNSSTTNSIIERIELLSPESTPQWGVMNIGQMLAHLNVAYDLAYGSLGYKSRPFARCNQN